MTLVRLVHVVLLVSIGSATAIAVGDQVTSEIKARFDKVTRVIERSIR